MMLAPIFKYSIFDGCFTMSSEQRSGDGPLRDQAGVQGHHPGSWAAGIIGSILLHALALSAFLWATENSPLPKGSPPVLDVVLIGTLPQSNDPMTEHAVSTLSPHLFSPPHHDMLKNPPTKIVNRKTAQTIIRPVPQARVAHIVPSLLGHSGSWETKKVVPPQMRERILPTPQPGMGSFPSEAPKAVHAEHVASTLRRMQRMPTRQTRPAGGRVRQRMPNTKDFPQVRLFQRGTESVVKKPPFNGDSLASRTIVPSVELGLTPPAFVTTPGTLQFAHAASPTRRVDQSQSAPASASRPGLVRKTLRASAPRMVPRLNPKTSATGEAAVGTFRGQEPTTVKRGSKTLSQPFAGSSTITGLEGARVPQHDSPYPRKNTDTRKPVNADAVEFFATRRKNDRPTVLAQLQPPSVVGRSGSNADAIPTDFRWLGTLLSTRLHGLPRVYPFLAKRQNWEGTVLLHVEIRQDGGLSGLRVARSSGYETLDHDAMGLIRQVCPLPVPQPLSLPHVALNVPVRYSLSEASE